MGSLEKMLYQSLHYWKLNRFHVHKDTHWRLIALSSDILNWNPTFSTHRIETKANVDEIAIVKIRRILGI